VHISFNKRDEIVETQLLKRGEALKPTKDPQNDADMAYTVRYYSLASTLQVLYDELTLPSFL